MNQLIKMSCGGREFFCLHCIFSALERPYNHHQLWRRKLRRREVIRHILTTNICGQCVCVCVCVLRLSPTLCLRFAIYPSRSFTSGLRGPPARLTRRKTGRQWRTDRPPVDKTFALTDRNNVVYTGACSSSKVAPSIYEYTVIGQRITYGTGTVVVRSRTFASITHYKHQSRNDTLFAFRFVKLMSIKMWKNFMTCVSAKKIASCSKCLIIDLFFV